MLQSYFTQEEGAKLESLGFIYNGSEYARIEEVNVNGFNVRSKAILATPESMFVSMDVYFPEPPRGIMSNTWRFNGKTLDKVLQKSGLENFFCISGQNLLSHPKCV